MRFLTNLFHESKEKEQFSIPKNATSYIISPDSNRLAYVVQGFQGAYVKINEKRFGSSYRAICGVTFSDDSQRLAYAARNHNNRWHVVFDENEYDQWDDIGLPSPIISPDAKHVIYSALKGHDWYAVLDNKVVGGPYEGFAPGGIVFSKDSQRFVYVVKKRDFWVAIVDGKEQTSFPTIIGKSWTFSHDSKKVAYIAGVKGNWAYPGAFIGESALVINGEVKQCWEYDGKTKKYGLSDEIYFSPDSKRIANSVIKDGKFFFVIDDEPQTQFDGLVSGREGDPMWRNLPDYGKASCKNDRISFSPDSRHFAYAVVYRDKHLLIYDGKQKAIHQSISNSPIVFSPDSKRVAYGAGEGTNQFMVIDWNENNKYDGIPAMDCIFSPNSEHIAYVASDSYNYLLIIDSKSWQIERWPIVGARLIWDDSNNLHTFTTKGNKIILSRFKIR